MCLCLLDLVPIVNRWSAGKAPDAWLFEAPLGGSLRVLGHATASMTTDLYGHLMDANLWEAAQAIGGILGHLSRPNSKTMTRTARRPTKVPDNGGVWVERSSRLGLSWANGPWPGWYPQVKQAPPTRSGGCFPVLRSRGAG